MALFSSTYPLLAINGEFHEFPGDLRAYNDVGKLCPLSRFIDPQNRTGLDISQGKSPRDTFSAFAELQFGLQVTTVVEGTHPVCSGLVVVGHNAKSLQSNLAISAVSANALNDKQQAVKFVVRVFGLNQLHRLTWEPINPCFPRPFTD